MEADGGFFLVLALMLLLFPLGLVAGILLAALIHECGHLIAVRLTGGRVLAIRLHAGGAGIETAPMPPGTGVMAATMGSTSSNTVSPDIPPLPLEVIFSGFQFIETSMTIWPSRTKSLVRLFRTPAAVTMMSALRQISAVLTVRVWQMVTVAFFAISIIAAGLPTTRLRPMTTAFVPLQSMP